MYSKVIIFYLAILSRSVFSSNAHSIEETTQPTSETENEAEFTVDIRYQDPVGREVVKCNGGIIANDIIVTTANCVINDAYVLDDTFRFVKHYTIGKLRSKGWLQRRKFIHTIYVPISYNSTTLHDNIAVIKLRRPMKLKKLGLNKLELLPKAFKIGDDAKMTTIGMVNEAYRYEGEDKKMYTIKFDAPFNVIANSRVINNTECQKIYPDLDVNLNFCAKLVEPDREFIKGCLFEKIATQGSILVNQKKNLIGLLAHKRNLCNETEDVQIYTDVYSQIDFITNAMNNQSLDTMYTVIYHY